MHKNKLKGLLVICILTLGIVAVNKLGIYNHDNVNNSNRNEKVNYSKETSNHSNQLIDEKVSVEVVVDDNSDMSKEDEITTQKAIDIISKYINSNNPNIKCSYDHQEKKDGVNYYVIHMYESMQDHVATLGWYYVDSNTGKSFKLNLVSDKLVPVE